MSRFGIGAIRSPAGTFFRQKERGIGPCLRIMPVCCGIAIAWCARAAETGDGRAVRYSFRAAGIPVPKGSVVLVGLDSHNLDSLVRPDAPARAADSGRRLVPIAGRVASNDLSIAVTVQPTQNVRLAMWDFGLQFSWKERAVRREPPVELMGGSFALSSTLTYDGSAGFSYRAVVEDPGEKSLPMSLAQVPTGVAGLTVHRIAYATAGGAVRSLLILVADSLATLSRRVRVGEDNAFRWHADWFVPLGTPVLDRSGAP